MGAVAGEEGTGVCQGLSSQSIEPNWQAPGSVRDAISKTMVENK